jgi:methionyl aminopeptidase
MAPRPDELPAWRRAARVAAEAREAGVRAAVPGARRRDVAEQVESLIRARGAEPAFPANLSRNVEAAHFTPAFDDEGVLERGDLLKVDVGAHVEGAIADTAATLEVGGGARHAHLIQAAREGLEAGVARVRAGVRVDEVSRAIEAAIHARGLKPVENLMGHSIEPYLLHAGKSIPNVGGLSPDVLREGEVIAIEPFATNGTGRIVNGPFGNILRFRTDPSEQEPALGPWFRRFRTLPFTLRWVTPEAERARLERSRRRLQSYPVFVEEGGGLVAQAEHTVLVTADGAEVLTAVEAEE